MDTQPSQPQRQKKYGPSLDRNQFFRFFQVQGTWLLLRSLFIPPTLKEVRNTPKNIHPQTTEESFALLRLAYPDEHMFTRILRLIFWKMLLSIFMVLVTAGLSIGCLFTLVNIITYMSTPHTDNQDQRRAYRNLGYWVMMFLLRSFCSQYSSSVSYEQAIKIDQILQLSLYDKYISLNHEYRKRIKYGDVYNLFLTDTKIIFNATARFPLTFFCLASLILAQIYLVKQAGDIGYMMLPVWLIAVVVQTIISYHMSKVYDQKQAVFQKRFAERIDMLNDLQAIKSLGWEAIKLQQLKQEREKENRLNFKYYILNGLSVFVSLIAPMLVMILVIILLAARGQLQVLNHRRIYLVSTYLNIITPALSSLTSGLVVMPQAIFAYRRLFTFLQGQDIISCQDFTLRKGQVVIENLVTTSGSDRENIKRVIPDYKPNKTSSTTTVLSVLERQQLSTHHLMYSTLKVPFQLNFSKGDRVIILSLDIESMNPFFKLFFAGLNISSGKFGYNGKLGYHNIDQFWFLRKSIKDNVVFYQDFDQERLQNAYNQVQMHLELDKLAKGDETVLEDSYRVLNVRQLKLIKMARALYYDADIYLINDLFNQSSAEEILWIYEKWIERFKNKTLFLTSSMSFFLKNNDKVLIMRDGEAIQYGQYSQLLDQPASYIHHFTHKHIDRLRESDLMPRIISVLGPESDYTKKVVEKTQNGTSNIEIPSQQIIADSGRALMPPVGSQTLTNLNAGQAQKPPPKPKQTNLSWKHYFRFIRSGPAPAYIGILFFVIVAQVCKIFGDWWLGSNFGYSKYVEQWKFIVVYTCLVLGTAVFTLFAGILTPTASRGNVQTIMTELNYELMKTDIMNTDKMRKVLLAFLYSKDNEDYFQVNESTHVILRNAFLFVGTFISMGIASWPMYIIGVATFMLNILIMYMYRKADQSVYAHTIPYLLGYLSMIEDVILNVQQIQVYKKRDVFRKMMVDGVYDFSTVIKNVNRVSKAAAANLSILVTVIATVILVPLAISKKQSFSPSQISMISLAISMSYRLNTYSNYIVTEFAFITSAMTFGLKSTYQFLVKINQFKPDMTNERDPPGDWPYHNGFRFENVSYRTPQFSRPLLNDVSLIISPRTRVGIYSDNINDVTIMYELLVRMKFPTKQKGKKPGKIVVGGLDNQQLRKHDLVKHAQIVNYRAYIVNGTIRQNLDPEGKHSNQQMLEVLDKMQFWEGIAEDDISESDPLFRTLDYVITDRGKSLPPGVSDAINIVRMVLKRPAIVFLQFPFSNIPLHKKIKYRQKMFQNLEQSSIVFSTQEVSAYLGADYLYGMRNGSVIEEGTPDELLQVKTSQLTALVTAWLPQYFLKNIQS